jgi:hypothetical protein
MLWVSMHQVKRYAPHLKDHHKNFRSGFHQWLNPKGSNLLVNSQNIVLLQLIYFLFMSNRTTILCFPHEA